MVVVFRPPSGHDGAVKFGFHQTLAVTPADSSRCCMTYPEPDVPSSLMYSSVLLCCMAGSHF